MVTTELSVDAFLADIEKCSTNREIGECVDKLEELYRAGELKVAPEDWPRISACVKKHRK